MTRYYRDRNGYLKRGTIFTNMNDRWQIIFSHSKGDCTWVSSNELFTLQPAETLRKSIPEHIKTQSLMKNLNTAVKEQNFEKAIVLRNILKEGNPVEKKEATNPELVIAETLKMGR